MQKFALREGGGEGGRRLNSEAVWYMHRYPYVAFSSTSHPYSHALLYSNLIHRPLLIQIDPDSPTAQRISTPTDPSPSSHRQYLDTAQSATLPQAQPSPQAAASMSDSRSSTGGSLGALAFDIDYAVVRSYVDKATSSDLTDGGVAHQEVLDDKSLTK